MRALSSEIAALMMSEPWTSGYDTFTIAFVTMRPRHMTGSAQRLPQLARPFLLSRPRLEGSTTAAASDAVVVRARSRASSSILATARMGEHPGRAITFALRLTRQPPPRSRLVIISAAPQGLALPGT